MATFAEQLTAARKAAGMTQEQLSDTLHVARNTISNWERGEREPDVETIKLLSQVLHTDFSNVDEMKSETPAENETEDGQERPENSSTKKRWPVFLAALAVIALGVVLGLVLGNNNSSYKPAARLADEAGQLTIEFFQKPAQKAANLPYLEFSYDSSVEIDNNQSVFFYTFRFNETNGYPFKIKSAVVYSFPPVKPFTDVFPADRLKEFDIPSEIPAKGEWTFGGGFPVQPYIGVAIILYGEDEHGTEMEFHGYIDYEKASTAAAQQ